MLAVILEPPGTDDIANKLAMKLQDASIRHGYRPRDLAVNYEPTASVYLYVAGDLTQQVRMFVNL